MMSKQDIPLIVSDENLVVFEFAFEFAIELAFEFAFEIAFEFVFDLQLILH